MEGLCLLDGVCRRQYRVVRVCAEEAQERRLKLFGIYEGSRIKIERKRRKRGSLVVRAQNSRIAMGPSIAEKIMVLEEIT